MNLDQALQTFLEESRELLGDMEQLLLDIEADPSDTELRNALFRCVHTIKGSAGMFGLDHVVNFTHVVENVLDHLRAEEIDFSGELAHLLLNCRDHMNTLVELSEPSNDPVLLFEETDLLKALEAFQPPASDPIVDTRNFNSSQNGPTSHAETMGDADTWHISVRFFEDVLRHGMDPLGFVRYLGELGELSSVTLLADSMPPLESMDPEACYLGFEIDLYANTDKKTIEEAFEFVKDLSQVRILPPRSGAQAYIDLINELPESAQRLGELLTASGALTEAELNDGLRLQASSSEPPQRKPIGEVLVEQGVVQTEVVTAALDKQSRGKAKASGQHLRVQAEKLDKLINLVGEMVIASSSVALNAEKSGDVATQESVAVLTSLVEAIRDNSLDLRMVPIGDSFQKFQRVVRDISSELGKDIQLVITGGDTELDKTVVEKIGDPLTHLVRNACDHGIELPDQRRGNGKGTKGTIHLNAYHESAVMVIEVSDDGNGLDRDRILAKAVERDLVKEDAVLTDQEVFGLIFEPGFSTSSSVTGLSGRGVGMDVVKRNIEALRGTTEVISPPSGGTTFRIRLPLTLAIIDGFLAKVGDATYVVPLEMVVECTELTEAQQRESASEHYINLRGDVLPFIRLLEHFELPGNSGRRQNIIVVRHGSQKAGLVVDDLLGEHQTVIKPLGGIFAHLKGLSGSTILGSGQVALILDVPTLIQQASQREEITHLKENRNALSRLHAPQQ